MKLKLEPAPLDVQVVDVWPVGRFDAAVRYAYREAQNAGRIRTERVVHDSPRGNVIVRYWTDIPVEWIHEELAGFKKRWNGDQISMEV